jgi:hypothetical protein
MSVGDEVIIGGVYYPNGLPTKGATDSENADGVFLASGARTTTQTMADQTNLNKKGIRVVVVTTAIGTGSITCAIQAKDPASGNWVTMLTGAAITTNTTNTYLVYPGAANTANVSANDRLPRTWRLLVTANNANSATYSVGYMLLG